MKTYDFDSFDACDLENILQAGQNITITKLDNCTLQISATGGGGGDTNNGIKYHLKSGDDITVKDCYEYFIALDFIVDSGARFTIENGGRLVIHSGVLKNDGLITNNGLINIVL